MNAAVARSAFAVDLTRYTRSWGLWLILLAGPVGARFMIAGDDGAGVQIAVGGQLPVMTSSTLGASLGIVVSTLLLPVGFIYLRSNTTRHRPWQVEDVTAAARAGLALGRFGADVAVLLAMLATLTLAGWFLGWLIVTGPLDLLAITGPLWLIAAPALAGIAALRVLFDAVPLVRRGFGETVFFILWLTALAVPIAAVSRPSSLGGNMLDFTGFLRPLIGPAPAGDRNFSIGSTRLRPGRVPLDVMAGIAAPGYVVSRFAWLAIAFATALFAGLVYRPRAAPRRRRTTGPIAKLLAARAPPAVKPDAPAARSAAIPLAGLIAAEFRLIGAGRLFKLLAVAAALAGLLGDYRHVGSPLALLVLAFGLSAHAGRSEARKLQALTGTVPFAPIVRRVAFVIAGAGWAALLALPGALAQLASAPLVLALTTGGGAAAIAIILATISGSAVAPRLVLLILWYAYLSFR